MTKQYLRVRNLDKYQRYSNRANPWVKLYCHILNDSDFTELPDREKLVQLLIIPVAVQSQNRIPFDPVWVRNRLSLRRVPKLKLLIDNGFFEVSAHILHTPQEEIRRDKKRKNPPNPPVGGTTPTPPKRQTPPGAVAKRMVQEYEALTGHKANDATYRSAQRLIDAGKGQQVQQAIGIYGLDLDANPREKQHRIKPHNFFGQNARWQEYAPESPQDAPGSTIISGVPTPDPEYDRAIAARLERDTAIYERSRDIFLELLEKYPRTDQNDLARQADKQARDELEGKST